MNLRDNKWRLCTNSTSERALAGRQRRERPKPAFIARAKVGSGWVTIGAAWGSGDPGLSIQLSTITINFDGRFVLLEPLENGEEPNPGERGVDYQN